MNPRTIGLEFEFISKIDRNSLTNKLQLGNIGLDINPQRNHIYSGWHVKTDGSITTQGNFGYQIEMVTPPLHENSYHQVAKALKIAKENGGVNASCGLHCHVFAPELVDMSAIQHRALEQFLMKLQPVLFTFMPPSRRSNSYCRFGFELATKYMAINFSPLHGPRTVEFRLHNATLNPVKAFSWAMLCRGIVDEMVRITRPSAVRQSTLIASPVLTLTPNDTSEVPDKVIKTRNNTTFTLIRDDKWAIESKILKANFPSIADGFKEFKEPLKLDSDKPLVAFRYPSHGNAIGLLCDTVGVRGMWKSYLEYRYDTMIKKHGAFDPNSVASELVNDENFYDEPLLDQSNYEAPTIARR